MKRKKALIILIAALLVLISLGFFFRYVIASIVLDFGKIQQHEIKSMVKSVIKPEKELDYSFGRQIKLPLPSNCGWVTQGRYEIMSFEYLTSSSNLDSYINETLSNLGWKEIDRVGDLHVIKNEANGSRLFIYVETYNRFYKRLIITPMDHFNYEKKGAVG